ncbi:Sec-independent protein translocase subunit TatA [Amycolatopsis methanolica]|uniref:Sec-independent protein translocase protein TatA n=1 Tax=Amycolatopsis methanolica 239 TaxID=1068978 RepID=A0A076MY71_AMYME|nr:Sec-independent protein translocase subunit TatA [Amycolatopsis methanolica]AIJ23620.1 sec-independent protein translocase protein TatA [Amycolatopsis methanolica 239]
MLNGLQPWHLIILVLVVVLLFGAKRLPDAARSIGKSMKIFKAETKDLREDGKAEEPEKKQIASSETTPSAADDQVAQLQKQLDELKRQQAAAKADQAHKHAS